MDILTAFENINPLSSAETRHIPEQKYKKWMIRNPYFGKKFSVLGDSASTLESLIPEGYECFYSGKNCEEYGVRTMQDTWWGMVIDWFGGELLANNSWAGSMVTGLPESEADPEDSDPLFPSGCSKTRTNGLHTAKGVPDVIIVSMGENDWTNSVQVKAQRTDSLVGKGADTFYDAYASIIGKLNRNYPSSEIWCCTLCEKYIKSDPSFCFTRQYDGNDIEEYNNVIRILSGYNQKTVDLYKYHIPYSTLDGIHPDFTGMCEIAALICYEMSDKKGRKLLCPCPLKVNDSGH